MMADRRAIRRTPATHALTPGLEPDYGRMRLYADVARALYTNVSGNQLVARTLFKVSVSVQF